jgi:hypothetical protein
MQMQQHEEVKTTTNYWGYRELSANEIEEVGGGGDFSGDGFGGNTGYGASSYTSYASSQPSNSETSAAAQQRALDLAILVGGMTRAGGADFWAAAARLGVSGWNWLSQGGD